MTSESLFKKDAHSFFKFIPEIRRPIFIYDRNRVDKKVGSNDPTSGDIHRDKKTN